MTLKSQNSSSRALSFPTFGFVVNGVRRLWRRVRRGVLILLLIFAVVFAGFNIYASVALNRELAQVSHKGQPLTMRDMMPPPVPEAQNAAPLYLRAVTDVKLDGKGERYLEELFLNSQPLNALGRKVLQEQDGALSLARQAAARPECRFDSNWSEQAMKAPPAILFPQYGGMRKLARLLRVQAVERARAGDKTGALENLRTIYRMRDHLKSEPVLIGYLVAVALENMANAGLAEVQKVKPLSAAEGVQFEASLPQTDWDAFYRHVLLGERATFLWGMEYGRADPLTMIEMQRPDRDSMGYSSPWRSLLREPLRWLWLPFYKLDELFYLRYWEHKIASVAPLQVPFSPALFTDDSPEPPFYALQSRSVLPVFAGIGRHRAAIEVGKRQRQIALAISAFRVMHKSAYPVNLAQASSAWAQPLPLDPYAAKPFMYRVAGDSFVLYSVGQNLRDDGGNSKTQRPSSGAVSSAMMSNWDDIVWNPRRR